VPSYVFKIKVAGTVRVRAADEMEARKVVPAVLVLPGPDEVRMANDDNAKFGWDATITSVNFRVKGDLKLVGSTGKRSKNERAEVYWRRKSQRNLTCATDSTRGGGHAGL
jgi:hypothetical protein